MTVTNRSRRPLSKPSVRATAPGSATPLVSIRMCSGCGCSASICCSAAIRSLPKLQHTQPPASCSSGPSRDSISASSIGSSPKSLTSTAMRRPSRSRSRWLTSVVLPAPR